MANVGFHASHEQLAPSHLLRLVQQAENAGFDAAMCSDHFHPWSEKQGQSGFAWSWLGAALQATQLSFGTVCSPGQRYHPAIIAQAAATMSEMFPNRFWLAVGSGEALNERITGESWPEHSQRNRRLRESVDVMRRLWAGEEVNHFGLVQVQNAKLFTLPASLPKLLGAALTPATAEWMGEWADGLITVGKDTLDLQKMIDAFHRGGGKGKPLFLQAALSFEDTEDDALEMAYQRWRHSALEREQIANLSTPREFDTATRLSDPNKVKHRLRVSSKIEQHIDWIRRDVDLGFDTIFLHYVGEDIERFIDVFADEVLPAVRG